MNWSRLRLVALPMLLALPACHKKEAVLSECEKTASGLTELHALRFSGDPGGADRSEKNMVDACMKAEGYDPPTVEDSLAAFAWRLEQEQYRQEQDRKTRR